jgi:hypothetical protein
MRQFTKYGLIAILLGLLLAYTDMRVVDSKYETYKQIHLGMTESDMLKLFGANNVQCIPVPRDEQAPVYQFSDYFREYSVSIDRTGRVAVLRFQFNHRSHGLVQLWTKR